MTTNDELANLNPVDLARLLDCGFIDRDGRGQLFVTMKGMALQARSARDVMLMRLGIPPGPEQLDGEGIYRANPAAVAEADAHFTVRIEDDCPPGERELAIRQEARELAERRYAAQLAGEVQIQPRPHLKAV